MTKWLLGASLILIAGCGSTSTEASGGNPTPTPGPGNFCGSFQVGPGLACDNTTNPPTLKVVYGTTVGTVAQGNDPRIGAGKGAYLGSFTQTAFAGGTRTRSNPGGILGTANALGVGHMIYSDISGKVGIKAADEICAAITDWPSSPGAVVPTAHACSMDELSFNFRNGTLTAGSGMAYTTAPFALFSPSSDPANSSWKASCGNWTYNSADYFQGTRWDILPQGQRNGLAAGSTMELKFTSSQPCGVQLPVACCS